MAVKAEIVSSLRPLAEAVLLCRSATYIDALCAKLMREGLSDAQNLANTSEAALEVKLFTHPDYNL